MGPLAEPDVQIELINPPEESVVSSPGRRSLSPDRGPTPRVVHKSFAAFAARRKAEADRAAAEASADANVGTIVPRRPTNKRLNGQRVKRQTKPSVPKQRALSVAKRQTGRSTAASQRHLVATLQRRIDARLRPPPPNRKAFC